MRTKYPRLRNTLLLIALAIIAFFPTDMLAASDSDMVGTWTAYGTAPNGALVNVTLRINSGGSGTNTVSVNGNPMSSIFSWFLTSDDIFCMVYPNGGRECGKVITVGPVGMTIVNNGGMTTYSRVGSQVPFRGTGYCMHSGCKCRAWAGGLSYNSPCPTSGCNHKYTEHYRPGD